MTEHGPESARSSPRPETPSGAAPPPPAAGAKPAPTPAPPWWLHPPRKTRWVRRIATYFFVLLFVLSVLVNVELIVLLVASGRDGFDTTVLQDGEDEQTVAVYTVNSLIDADAAAMFERFYRVVRNDENIKAVVVRVDSGGGGIAASDEIHRRIKSIREDLHKPVVVSMGGVAASGGYYISAPADAIYAEPTTMTGSIGVIATWPVFKGMLEKHGVEMVTIRSTAAERWKAKENLWETPDARIRENVEEMLNKYQKLFEQAVRDGRGQKLKLKQVEVTVKDAAGKPATITETQPFDGRVYLADEAQALGLVDKVGYLDEASKAAAGSAGLTQPKVVSYRPSKGLLERLVGAKSSPGIQVDEKLFDKLQTPRIMMLWKAQ